VNIEQLHAMLEHGFRFKLKTIITGLVEQTKSATASKQQTSLHRELATNVRLLKAFLAL